MSNTIVRAARRHRFVIIDLRKRGDLGRDGIYRLLRELRDAGYMRFVRKRDRHGRIRGGTYFVQEIATAPHQDLPDMVEPDTAEPYPLNPEALPTTDLNLKRTTTTTPINTTECSSYPPRPFISVGTSQVCS